MKAIRSLVRLCTVVVVSLGVGGLAQPVLALDEPEKAEGEFSDEIFVEGSAGTVAANATAATGLELPLQETPVAISVVTRALINEQDGRTLSDALNNAAGVNVQSQLGIHDYYVIRGFDSLSSSLVLTDGAVEPEASFYQLYNVERVEVVRGPASFRYGGNALGSVINLVPRRSGQEMSWGAEAGVGSWNNYLGRFDLDLGRQGGAGFRVLGQFEESDGYRDRTSSRNRSLNPMFDFRLGESSELHLYLEALRSEYTPDAGLPIAGPFSFDVPATQSYQSPFDFSDQSVARVRLNWTHTLSANTTLRNKTYYTSLDWRSDGTIFGFVLPDIDGDGTIFRNLLALEDDQVFWGNTFEWQSTIGRQQLIAGVELSERSDAFTIDVGFLNPISIRNPVETTMQPVPIDPRLREAGDSDVTIAAPYFMDRIAIAENAHVFVGARYDRIEFEDRLLGRSMTDDQLSPLLGFQHAPNQRFSWYGNYSQGFSPPSTRARGELVPEESEQIELGLKGVAGRHHLSLALYDIERQNMAIPDDNGITTQTGSQTSSGLELEVAGSFGPAIRYQLAGAYNDSELTEFKELFVVPGFGSFVFDHSGNRPAFSPEHIWNFWLAKNFKGGLGIAGGGRFLGSQFISEDNVYEAKSSFLVDAAVFYEFADWRLAANFKNLTDEAYDTRGFGTTSVLPGQGRSVFVSAEIRK